MSDKPNPIVLVDFDGVIHSYSSGWQGADVVGDPPVRGAIDWLVEHLPIPEPISAMGPPYTGPEVQIYSSRSRQSGGVKAMQEWLVRNGLHRAYISEGILKFPTQKPAAFLTIDDRAICFDGRFPTSEEMMAFKPWNKREAGATGKYPDGHISPEDEGEIQFKVWRDQDNVAIDFGKPVAWLAFPPELARQLAAVLIRHADQVRE